MTRILMTAAATLVALAGPARHAGAASYQYLVTDLGTLSGPISSATNLNATAEVAGLSTLANSNYHAMFWNGAPIDLGTVGSDTQSMAHAVNDAGVVVGVSYNYGDLQPHAYRWNAGTLTPLGNFSPRDINVPGVIVGHFTFYDASNLWIDHACRWENGVLSDLGTLGGHNSEAFAINAVGQIVGQSFLPDDITLRACLWSNGVAHDLGTIVGTTGSMSAATDLNNQGQIAGWSQVAAGQPHACRFQVDANGQVTQRTDLGVLGGGYSYAYGINDSGVVVGASDARGFVAQANAMVDLNTLVPPGANWMISRAAAINETGVIAAEGVRFGFAHAVLLTPVSCLKGDINDDGFVNGLDVQPFEGVLLDGGTPRQICAGDLGAIPDGDVTASDVDGFVECLLAGGCG